VRVRQHLILADDHTGADTPTLPNADDRVAGLISHALDLFLDFV
jgi:hypothetical protein